MSWSNPSGELGPGNFYFISLFIWRFLFDDFCPFVTPGWDRISVINEDPWRQLGQPSSPSLHILSLHRHFASFGLLTWWPHALSGELKRCECWSSSCKLWTFDQRNEGRVCMNVTSRSHLSVGWSGEGSYLFVHVFDHFALLLVWSINSSYRMPFWWLAQAITRHWNWPDPKNPPCERVRLSSWDSVGELLFHQLVYLKIFIWWFLSVRDAGVRQNLSDQWRSLATARPAKFSQFAHPVSPSSFCFFWIAHLVTPCLIRWTKKVRVLIKQLQALNIWSKKRGTSVHERDEYII